MPKISATVVRRQKNEIAAAAGEQGFRTPADWLYKQIVDGLERARLLRVAKQKQIPPAQ